jgi:hypothetical protein
MKNKCVVPNQVLSISTNEIELQQYAEINAAQITELATTNEDSLKVDQISSARRSLKTNLVLITLFILLFFFIFFIPNRQFFSVFIYSVLKGVLPILTTIANFGTIRSVIRQYYHNFKNFCE